MCGILASINCHFGHDELMLIKHRGPDSDSIEQISVGANKIVFGQTRLAILELSDAGKQPMWSDCGNYMITFNGEIYNHMELRSKLEKTNFKGHSDTESILYYLIQFGKEGIKDFNGIFGLAFLDIKKRSMILARDHFGVKPIYYYQKNEQFLFSSEIRPIQEIINSGIDKENLSTLLRLRYLPSPLTPYQNIRKLKPGHCLSIDLTLDPPGLVESSFITKLPMYAEKTKQNKEEFAKHVENAVNRQMMADVEVGVLLSGGLDSAVIAALAQKQSAKKIKAFTVGFEGDYAEDEIEYAKETADLLGLDHFHTKIDFKDFIKIFKETTRIIEEPLATTSVIPMYYLAEFASRSVKVVLTGQGADEPLGGYARYQGELIGEKLPRSLFKIGAKLSDTIGIKNERILRAVSSLSESDDVKRFVSIYSIFSNSEIERLIGKKENKSYELISYYYNLLDCKSRETSVERMMAIDTRMNLSDDLLLYSDKITMNFALECRVPFLDTELIKYIESLSCEDRIVRSQGKVILRDYAKQILPSKIINRPKKGFQSPTVNWFKTYNEEIKNILISSENFTTIFNAIEVEKILKQHLQGYNREKQIFLLLSICFWLENVEEAAKVA